ncbi:hypothetical protein F5Y01DRAFT_288175 [Xylaria sp. FL0043]|nr:hypothetical protein F5Y01DRAFT_288175 [Xylaria sp. FL0043]
MRYCVYITRVISNTHRPEVLLFFDIPSHMPHAQHCTCWYLCLGSYGLSYDISSFLFLSFIFLVLQLCQNPSPCHNPAVSPIAHTTSTTLAPACHVWQVSVSLPPCVPLHRPVTARTLATTTTIATTPAKQCSSYQRHDVCDAPTGGVLPLQTW